MANRKRISLSDEVSLAMHAIDGAHRVAERIVETDDAGTARRLSQVVEAILVVTRERLRLLGRTIQNEVDPALLWCEETQAAADDQDDDDFVLEAWSERGTRAPLKLVPPHRHVRKRRDT